MFVVKFHPQRVWALQIWVQIDLANQLVEAVLSNIGSSTGLIHKQFWLCGWGGMFKPHAVRPVCLKHTGCHMIRPKLTGWSKGQVHLLNLVVTQELPSFKLCHLSFPYFSPNGRWSLTGRCSSSVWKIACCIENGRHMLKPVPWAIWTVKLCWPMIHLRSGSDGPQPYTHMAMLLHALFEVMFGWSSSTIQLCWHVLWGHVQTVLLNHMAMLTHALLEVMSRWSSSTIWLCWHMLCLRSCSDGPPQPYGYADMCSEVMFGWSSWTI